MRLLLFYLVAMNLNIKKSILLFCGIFTSLFSFAQKPTAGFLYTGQCEGTPIMFEDISSTPSGHFDRWHWDFGTGNAEDTANAQYQLFTYNSSGTFQVTLIVWNNFGISDTVVNPVTVFPSPKAAIKITTACFPDSLLFEDVSTISAGTVPDRDWDISLFRSKAKTVKHAFAAPGDYSIFLTAKSDKGCLNIKSDTITYYGPPTLTFNPASPTQICEGDNVTLSVAGADTYLWENGNATNTITANTTGYYKVTGTVANLCQSTDSVYVEVLPNPIADAGPDSTITEGDTLILQGSGGQYYSWSPATYLSDPSIANPSAYPKATIPYTLSVVDTNGCTDSDDITITVLPKEIIDTTDTKDTTVAPLAAPFVVHNLLTPNGDGHNDVWDLRSVPDIETATIYVFNRWGKEVFMAENYQHNWGGTYNGEPLTDGTYVYVIKFNDEKTVARGALEIVRNTKQ
jgi:gliding motility-associated-like protein